MYWQRLSGKLGLPCAAQSGDEVANYTSGSPGVVFDFGEVAANQEQIHS